MLCSRTGFRAACRAVLMLGGLAASVPIGIDSGGGSRGRYRFAIILVDGRSVYPWLPANAGF